MGSNYLVVLLLALCTTCVFGQDDRDYWSVYKNAEGYHIRQGPLSKNIRIHSRFRTRTRTTRTTHSHFFPLLPHTSGKWSEDIAFAYYKVEQEDSGWDRLYVTTNEAKEDEEQMYGAGYLVRGFLCSLLFTLSPLPPLSRPFSLLFFSLLPPFPPILVAISVSLLLPHHTHHVFSSFFSFLGRIYHVAPHMVQLGKLCARRFCKHYCGQPRYSCSSHILGSCA